jgi:Flp pilus assembly pilin Flp
MSKSRFTPSEEVPDSRSEVGVVAIEYVLLGAAVIVAIIAAFAVFVPDLVARYDTLL